MSSAENCDESHKEKKFGIPNWMVHNIERLNVATDFEQYGQSPLESEGFLVDLPDNTGAVFSSKNIVDGTDASKTFLGTEKVAKVEKHEVKVPDLYNSHTKYDNLHKSLIEVLKCDDAIYSSPDSTPYSTPYSTPQPSPAPQRKISFSSQETVQSNPEKWFYLGGKDKNKLKLLKSKEKEKTLFQTLTDIQAKKFDEKAIKPIKTSLHENHVKLAISNFDLNAISPSSW